MNEDVGRLDNYTPRDVRVGIKRQEDLPPEFVYLIQAVASGRLFLKLNSGELLPITVISELQDENETVSISNREHNNYFTEFLNGKALRTFSTRGDLDPFTLPGHDY